MRPLGRRKDPCVPSGDSCTVDQDPAAHAPDDDVEQVMQRMQRERVRRIPVVDDDGRLLGIISQADLAMKVGPQNPQGLEPTLGKISGPTRA